MLTESMNGPVALIMHFAFMVKASPLIYNIYIGKYSRKKCAV